jgi:site-specific DNA-adenine methylase
MAYKSLFSYYGGKSKLAHLYPKPKHDLIIEPFCGGASYALLYRDREVLINDLDDKTFAIWKYLLRNDALDIWYQNVHLPIIAGIKISEIISSTCDKGLIYLLQAESNQGTQGARGVRDQVTKRGSKFFDRLIKKMEFFLPQIKHWQLTHTSYENIPNQKATWFVDPPYSNLAGSSYRCALDKFDFAYLHEWVRHIQGQVITCENDGATWDDFVPLRTRLGFKSDYQKSNAMEMFCERNSCES